MGASKGMASPPGMAAPPPLPPQQLAWAACPAPHGAGQPQPRSGHSFTTLAGGETHVLFGGTGHGSGGKAAYLSDAHVCRTGADGTVAWTPLDVQGPQVGAAPRRRVALHEVLRVHCA